MNYEVHAGIDIVILSVLATWTVINACFEF